MARMTSAKGLGGGGRRGGEEGVALDATQPSNSARWQTRRVVIDARGADRRDRPATIGNARETRLIVAEHLEADA
jgi:hypothetical protein